MGGEIIFKACPTTALLHSENPTAPHHRRHHGWVAQSAEQWTENPRVGGSIPPPATPYFSEVKREGKRALFAVGRKRSEMKEITRVKKPRRNAAECNLSGRHAPCARGRQNRFDRAGLSPQQPPADLGEFVEALAENRACERGASLLANQARFFFRRCEEDRFLRAISAASR